MIGHPAGIIAALLFIEGLVIYLSENQRTKFLFKFLAPMFWIYTLPMLATTFNIIPQENDAYRFIPSIFLPASLILLIITADLKAILKLGRLALIMFFTGSLGIMIGGPLVLFLFKKWLPQDIWMGFGALSGSWIGGSANMIAIKEGIGTPDKIFLPMVIVDSVVAYAWMGILIALAGYQAVYNKWNRADNAVIEELNHRLSGLEQKARQGLNFKHTVVIFTIAFLGTYASTQLAARLPEVKNVIATYTWTIILATTLGVILSLTRIRKLELCAAPQIGYVMLYFVLASIGARASLKDIASIPILILAGFTWVFIHALVIFSASRIFRAPMFLVATASQANIGGTASAPVVAAVYQPALAPVGLLLAVIGNIIGTYLGIICAQLCKFVSG